MKKVISCITAIILIFMMSGCNEIKKSEKTVSGMMDSFKSLDFEAAKNYVDINELSLSENNNDLTSNAELFMKNLFNKLNYKIVSSEKIDKSTVLVKTEITAVDMKPVIADYFSSAMQFALSNAFSVQQFEGDALNKKLEELLVASLSKPDLKTISKTVDIKVVKEDNKWKVAVDDAFIDALFGGLQTAVGDLEKSFAQNTE